MKKVYKYYIGVKSIPEIHKLVHVAEDSRGEICLWLEVDVPIDELTTHIHNPYVFFVTGEEIVPDHAQHVMTAITKTGYVCHIYDIREK